VPVNQKALLIPTRCWGVATSVLLMAHLSKFVDNLDAHWLGAAWRSVVVDEPIKTSQSAGKVIAFAVASAPLRWMGSCHVVKQVLPLLKHSQRYPERLFNFLCLTRQQRSGGERMSGVAAISNHGRCGVLRASCDRLIQSERVRLPVRRAAHVHVRREIEGPAQSGPFPFPL
jgi:hypothetical protein